MPELDLDTVMEDREEEDDDEEDDDEEEEVEVEQEMIERNHQPLKEKEEGLTDSKHKTDTFSISAAVHKPSESKAGILEIHIPADDKTRTVANENYDNEEEDFDDDVFCAPSTSVNPKVNSFEKVDHSSKDNMKVVVLQEEIFHLWPSWQNQDDNDELEDEEEEDSGLGHNGGGGGGGDLEEGRRSRRSTRTTFLSQEDLGLDEILTCQIYHVWLKATYNEPLNYVLPLCPW